MKTIYSIVVLAMASISLAAHSNENKICKNNYLSESYKDVFPASYDAASRVITNFCSANYSGITDISQDLILMADTLETDVSNVLSSEANFDVKSLNRKIKDVYIKDGLLAPVLNADSSSGIFVQVGSHDIEVKKVDKCDENVKGKLSEKGYNSCQNFVEGFVKLYNLAQRTVQSPQIKELKKYIKVATSEWENFYKHSRSQTSLEAYINGRFWRNGKKEGEFLSPPNGQFIFLHPSIVVENVSEALDGQNTQEGIMIEIAGYNWWMRNKWYQMSGASVVAVHSDRTEIQDDSYGFAFHFGNKYTLGAVDRDGDTGVFISMDLLELVKDKNKLINSYIGKLK